MIDTLRFIHDNALIFSDACAKLCHFHTRFKRTANEKIKRNGKALHRLYFSVDHRPNKISPGSPQESELPQG